MPFLLALVSCEPFLVLNSLSFSISLAMALSPGHVLSGPKRNGARWTRAPCARRSAGHSSVASWK